MKPWAFRFFVAFEGVSLGFQAITLGRGFWHGESAMGIGVLLFIFAVQAAIVFLVLRLLAYLSALHTKTLIETQTLHEQAKMLEHLRLRAEAGDATVEIRH